MKQVILFFSFKSFFFSSFFFILNINVERMFLNVGRMLKQFLLILLSPLRQGLPSNDHKYTDYFTLYHLYDVFFIYMHSVLSSFLQCHGLQAPLSMGLFRQEYWSGLQCPPPRDLPDSGMEPTSPALHLLHCFTHLIHQGKSTYVCLCVCVLQT